MSRSPLGAGSQSPYVSGAPTVNAGQKKRGCGCLGTVSGAILFILAVSVFLNPWALHMGGRWTPALTWHGAGKLHATTGATYGLFLEVYLRSSRHVRGRNLEGTAKLCTPQGQIYPLKVEGYVKQAWLDADGKQLTLSFASPKAAEPKLKFELLGSWQGQQLVLNDKGSMAMSFAEDGSAKGYLRGTNAATENATVTLEYATESEFGAVCPANRKSSF